MLSDKQIADKVKLMYSLKYEAFEEVENELIDYICDGENDKTSSVYEAMSRHRRRLETEINILQTILQINQ